MKNKGLMGYTKTMSFDVFISCFMHGQASGVPEADVRSILGSALQGTPDASSWQVTYGQDYSTFCISRDDNDPTQIASITVNRPIADSRLWDDLHKVLSLGNFVLFFPDGRCPLVARKDAVPHLPRDMIDALGEPEVVASGSD